MLLSLLPDRGTERERERDREGGKRVTEGVLYKKEGRSAQKDKVLGLVEGDVWCWKGDGLGLCRTELLRISQTIIHDSKMKVNWINKGWKATLAVILHQ